MTLDCIAKHGCIIAALVGDPFLVAPVDMPPAAPRAVSSVRWREGAMPPPEIQPPIA